MSIGGAILELLFPTKCAFCHRLTEGREQRVCPRCIKSLAHARGAAAERDEWSPDPFTSDDELADTLPNVSPLHPPHER